MNPELARLRQQIAYEPTRAGAVGDRLRSVARQGLKWFEQDAQICERIKKRFAGTLIESKLTTAYEAVALLVGSELDSDTPGDRGLGRVTTEVPRFGGAFREQLRDSGARQALGPLMEDLVIDGFGAGALYDALDLTRPLTKFRDRDQEALLEAWIANGVGTWRWPPGVVRLHLACSEPATDRFVSAAEACGLVGGIRKRSRRETLTEVAWLLTTAGSHLLAAHAPESDPWFT